MKRKLKIFTSAICLIPLISSAQIDSICLQGRFVDTVPEQGGRLEVQVIHPNAPFERQTMFLRLFTSPIIGGKFKLSVPVENDWVDVYISWINSAGKEMLLSGGTSGYTYLMYKRDRPQLLIRRNGGVDFSGVGSEKLSCQEQINSLGFLPMGALLRIDDLYNKDNYTAAYSAELLMLKRQLELKKAILETYRDSIPPEIAHRIWLDVIGNTFISVLNGLNINSNSGASTSLIAAKAKIIDSINKLIPIDTSQAAILSVNYTSSLLLEERLKLRYQGGDNSIKSIDIPEFYQDISLKYHGEIKDKLLFLLYLQLSSTMRNSTKHIDSILSTMGNNASRNMLEEWKSHLTEGSPAYPFVLPDPAGKFFSLNDLKGKIIIADFWFTGCENCINIPPAMNSVCEKYKNNKNVVFLSINVDKQKKWWEEGLKEGKYTIRGSIHLSTIGEGMYHPLLKFYNYNSYPQLLVVDQKGKTVSVSPPDPRRDQGKGLSDLIDNLLIKNSISKK